MTSPNKCAERLVTLCSQTYAVPLWEFNDDDLGFATPQPPGLVAVSTTYCIRYYTHVTLVTHVPAVAQRTQTSKLLHLCIKGNLQFPDPSKIPQKENCWESNC